ncbi:MAG: prolyl oligopeptidase family serine peptidase [Undibacterium sp.]|nr:prolyl oligopeptidase family serine peptidase [Undibacterium sp.]
MKLTVRYCFTFAVLLLLSSLSSSAQDKSDAAAQLPGIELFFENPSFSEATLSPNGKLLAVLIAKKDTRKLLAIYEISNAKVTIVADYRYLDVGHFQWISDTRLVFDAFDNQKAQGESYEAPGLFAVNADGTSFRQLVSQIQYTEGATVERRERELLPWYTQLLRNVGRQNSEYVYVERPMMDSLNWNEISHVTLLRLNTLTGYSERVDGPFGVRYWLLDHSGEPRVAVTLNKNIETVNYLDPETKKWRKLAEFDTYRRGQAAFTPHGFGADGRFYVVTNNGGDKDALYTFDLNALKLSEKPVFSLSHYDYTGSLVTNASSTLGVRFQSDADETFWFDQKMGAIQKTIDAKLPNTLNRISLAQRSELSVVLVESYSDVQPKVYFLYNFETGEINKVGEMYRNILPSQMGTQQMVRYKARDGLEITAYLTLPPGSKGKNLPLVVMVHGGPFVRGKTWGWDAQTQFLASRGYAVLEPEFRGSRGFGGAHFHAGWKQWGLAMQDDIADGTKWAIDTGIAAPNRICIAGASYGGYATLMGLINNPELYRCGFEWVGVTDIKLMFDGYRGRDSDLPEVWKKYGMPVLIGDPILDAEQLKATSPLLQAARIKQPLLLAYGGADRRVPLFHGTTFRDAVKKHNQEVEWLEYRDEGHGWFLPKNRIDFWGRVEKFLQRQIGQ